MKLYCNKTLPNTCVVAAFCPKGYYKEFHITTDFALKQIGILNMFRTHQSSQIKGNNPLISPLLSVTQQTLAIEEVLCMFNR